MSYFQFFGLDMRVFKLLEIVVIFVEGNPLESFLLVKLGLFWFEFKISNCPSESMVLIGS